MKLEDQIMSIRVLVAEARQKDRYDVWLVMHLPDDKSDETVYCGTCDKENAGYAVLAAWCVGLGESDRRPISG